MKCNNKNKNNNIMRTHISPPKKKRKNREPPFPYSHNRRKTGTCELSRDKRQRRQQIDQISRRLGTAVMT